MTKNSEPAEHETAEATSLAATLEGLARNSLGYPGPEEPDWETYDEGPHDWRRYVPDVLVENWELLGDAGRAAVYLLCCSRASAEDWE